MIQAVNARGKLVSIALGAGLLSVTAFICFLVRYMGRGFELSDETFYLYYSSHYSPQNYNTTFFGYLNDLVCFGSPTLLHLRAAKLILQLVSVSLFIAGLFRFLTSKGFRLQRAQKGLMALIIILASFCHYDYLPMTLSYNSWSLIGMLGCFAILFYEATVQSRSAHAVTAFIYGFICFCFFVAKMPNAIIAMVLYGGINLFVQRRNVLVKLGGFLLGLGAGYAVVLNSYSQLLQIIENYRITLFDVKHAESGLYVKQISKSLVTLTSSKVKIIVLAAGILAAGFGFYVIRKLARGSKKGLKYAVLVGMYIVSIPFWKGNGHISFNDFIVGTLLIGSAVLFVYFFKRDDVRQDRGPFKETRLYQLALFLMPVLLMLGTNNAFWYSTSPTMVFAVTASLIYVVSKTRHNEVFLSLYLGVISLFISCILYFGVIHHPYQQSSLVQKTYPLPQGGLLEGISEDYASYVDFMTVTNVLNRYNPNHKPVLVFFEFFGYTVLSNSASATSLPLSSKEQNAPLNDYLLSHLNASHKIPVCLVPQKILDHPHMTEMLARHGLSLDKDYRLLYTCKLLGKDETICIYGLNN